MPFIPHTEKELHEMLQTIGETSIDALFDEIPSTLPRMALDDVPTGMPEMMLKRLLQERAAQDGNMSCFIGAGAYEHHVPAAVWEIATRGEFYTAYTPYQAEASQGSLQLIYEFQTMMASLMGLDVSNASLYDGATALAEAILMAVRIKIKKGQAAIMIPTSLHPLYRATVKTIVSQQGIEIIDVPYDKHFGYTDVTALDALKKEYVAALVIPQPNFFGVLEPVDALTDWAKAHNLLSIAVVNPMSSALLKAPGQWGQQGVDIAVGEGQPLGIPLTSGGPYYGFLCAKMAYVRQMPGRIVGRTTDKDGKQGFVLTLQAREQHIRRGKATSNICTNQGLMVTASTIYMSLLGPLGLKQIAMASHLNTKLLLQALTAIPGVQRVFQSAYFHEIVVSLPVPVLPVIKTLARCHIQAGVSLAPFYPELGNAMLICVTETKTKEDIQLFADSLQEVLTTKGANTCLA